MKNFNLVFDFCRVSDYMHGMLELNLVGCMEMKSLSSFSSDLKLGPFDDHCHLLLKFYKIQPF